MRAICPFCGWRDQREFAVKGAALDRPDGDWGAAWHDYLHLRDNPAGGTAEHWVHVPCGAWVVMRRDTVTHAVVAGDRPGGDG